MIIFEVKDDVMNYQSIGLQDTSYWDFINNIDCNPVAVIWEKPGVYISNPKLKRGNFYHLSPGFLVFDKKAYDCLLAFFEMSGEILTLPCEDEDDLYLLNILECRNALDKQKTTFRHVKGNLRYGPIEYHFHRNRLTETPLFKIPETSRAEILTYSGMKDSEDEFIHAYHTAGMTGLTFKELWNDDH